jgi:anti-sigma regulatory factor (Ser/Thr protein kinase)
MKDLSMHILDIAQNSTRAGAKEIFIEIVENRYDDTMTVSVKDNGSGMDQDTLDKVLNPFFTTRTTRKVGLGLPLLKQNAERSGGRFSITSELGKGTEVIAVFGLTNIDRPPLGDIAGVIVLTAASNPEIRFVFHFKNEFTDYLFDTVEINEVLDGVPINNPDIVLYLRKMVDENIGRSDN